MSQNQTLSLVNNDTQDKRFSQQQQFREKSIKDQSIHNFDIHATPAELRQNAIDFLNTYVKLDQTFPINTLKESSELKVKQYKQSVYYGEIHNGKKNGLGIMIYKNGRKYQGQWVNDQKKGFGVEVFPNQCIFKGSFLNGKPNGVGCYSWPNGQYYDGQWMNGFKHGSGMWRGYRGDSYKGQWKFGKPEGYGVHTWLNGDNYQGQFKECLKHGDGIERFSNGDMYKGSYINGKPSGYGQYYWNNGSYFKGSFINGLRDGKGVWKKGVGNSDRYDGQYKNDKKWGYGIFTWATGNIYKGNYEADMRNGFGQMHWTNGTYYKGQWVSGIQNGQGQIYIPHQGFKKGIFQNNVIIEVWEQRLINKNAKLKNVIGKSKKTEQSEKIRYPKTCKNGDNDQRRKKQNNTEIRSQKYRIRQKNYVRNRVESVGNNSFQRKKSLQSESPKEKLFFSNNKLVSQNKEKINASINFDVLKSSKLQKSSVKNHSRQRLLHSSFYLYKLNLKHNIQTQKSLKKKQGDQNSKQTLLFRGKLMPDN